jgi:hypothetical protein
MIIFLGINSLEPHGTYHQSHDSSVGIALGYELDDRGSRVRFPAGPGNFSLHHRVQNGSGAHPASYPMGTRGPFPGGKAADAWSWPLTSILCRGQRMRGAVPPLPQYAFKAWCSSKKAQGQLYLLHDTYHTQYCKDEKLHTFSERQLEHYMPINQTLS